ncbi:hypothetical protein ACXX82_17275 [Glaciimonas sp. GNP009]
MKKTVIASSSDQSNSSTVPPLSIVLPPLSALVGNSPRGDLGRYVVKYARKLVLARQLVEGV